MKSWQFLLGIFIVVMVAGVGILAGGRSIQQPTPPAIPSNFGWDLDTSVIPEPAPFSEPAPEMAHLFAYANESAHLLSRCETRTTAQEVADMAGEWRLRSFRAIVNACEEAHREAMRELALEANANGTASSKYRELNQAAAGAQEQARMALKAMPPPGTYADAEFQSYLQRVWDEQTKYLESSRRLFDSFLYSKGDPNNEANLVNTFIGLRGVTDSHEVLARFARDYSWQPGTCNVPGTDEQADRIQRLYDEAYDVGVKVAEPDDWTHISNPFGYLIRVTAPSIANHTREGHTMALLDLEADLQWSRAYFENLSASSFPTPEEAAWLVELHRSKVHDLSTAGLYAREKGVVETFGRFWEKEYAARSVALQAVTWPFARLQCQAASLGQPTD